MGTLAELVARARANDRLTPSRAGDGAFGENLGEPISPFAMDIVDNCNLRCPFCVYDYGATHRTNVMSDAVFAAALRFAPFATPGNFWLSCLHEATLHPRFAAFIERIPRRWRGKIMFTTNLAKPMPESYFALLGHSGLHHVNVSLESLDPALYERMRKGARFRIFMANRDLLLDAVRAGPAPPRLRYNLLAFRSNLGELPDLVERLLADWHADQVEIRDLFPERHIPESFLRDERLDAANWRDLRARLAHIGPDRLVFLGQGAEAASPALAASGLEQGLGVARPLRFRVEWNGTLVVYDEVPGPNGLPIHTQFVTTNVLHIRDAASFVAAL